MKKYTLELVVNEGNDEFWEQIADNGKTGCDEILDAITEQLGNWPEIEIKMIKFEDK